MNSAKIIVEKAIKEGRFKLLEHEAYSLLGEYGIPVPEAQLARSSEEAGDLAEKIGYPIVLKIVSPDIIHKSDVGGVVVGLNDRRSVVEAATRIFENVKRKAPNARVAGVLVQKMVPQGVEVIVGGLRDAVFGPVVMFGLGGIFVEVLKDVTFRIAPVDEREALNMINEVKAKTILEGYRGNPPVDKRAIARVIMGVSKLLEDVEEVESIDLNPIMAFPDKCIVADARIIVGRRKL